MEGRMRLFLSARTRPAALDFNALADSHAVILQSAFFGAYVARGQVQTLAACGLQVFTGP